MNDYPNTENRQETCEEANEKIRLLTELLRHILQTEELSPKARELLTQAIHSINQPAAPLPRPQPDKEIILLVETNPEQIETLTQSLSPDYQVISVGDGNRALELAREINPYVILSDIILPGLRGDEMCRRLKSSIETSHIPLIFLSALSERENIMMGLEAGANDYITKPFNLSILKTRIRNINNDISELDKNFLNKTVHIIEEEMDKPDFSINEFCNKLAMSRTSVYNKIKTLTGQSPNDYIRIHRLNKARELLKTKQYTIVEVANLVGFSDPKYFSTAYKKHFTTPPSKDI
ncbi:DNA-binding response OmpR family regulator [Parabacteroides sp. PF5-5]|uniref:response regulator transcription factor n=1 Tax=unclassified Parabacteroides TaxID=2649774 RepID=UPI0024744076|nr:MULTISPECIES: response regulator [unclassified Parabacteroides]MDH6304961.1 DNA-binding response OmpR family regulator [Parabacteroides sp. PH5-39]MDH6315953.1 DNA-binding response OmpR family regulator [Parabacteroides sp. PF5-13]MDH6319610.1 DNA-binding response OmpR family regulator [Parabacteroides sp. PH5-13]MDH6323341.1 DNA-binding response OmpR family regulator [Parabacteroides sp. PH5-8]MDH6327150.1 DNA-binding response OmpR family regulator [Parabacteroides sp. PH5-41]